MYIYKFQHSIQPSCNRNLQEKIIFNILQFLKKTRKFTVFFRLKSLYNIFVFYAVNFKHAIVEVTKQKKKATTDIARQL